MKRRIIAIGSNLKPKTRLSKTALIMLVLTGTICVPGFVLTNRTDAELTEEVSEIVQGIVINRDGKPIPNAQIFLYHNISNWDFENRIEQTTTSTADGSFRFDDPLKYNDINEYPKGRDSYVLVATHTDYALGWYNITKGQEQDSYELTLTEPQTETVTVTDHDGNPLSGVRVWPYNLGSPSGPEPLFRDTLSIRTDVGISGAITGSDGKAVITNLPQTRISYHATLKGYATGLAFPSQRTIRLNEGATVSGTVLDEFGEPVDNALVKFFTNWGFWQYFLTKTDSQGRFLIEDIPAEGWDMSPWGSPNGNGSYLITIEHDGYISSETQDQFIPGEIKEDFIIDAYRGTLVKCNVVEEETGRPIAGARINGFNESGRIDGRTDADGVFSFRVIPGKVSLIFLTPPEGFYILGNMSPNEYNIDFNAQGQEMTVTLEAPKIAGQLTTVKGKVLLPDGSPAAGIGIYTIYEESLMTGRSPAYTGTNSDGTFELQEIPTGTKIFLYGNTTDFQYILAETINSVEEATELPTPLVMEQGQVADVLFTDEKGNPLADMSLKITPMIWGNHIPRADEHFGQTDAQGYLVINGIMPGMEYFIMDARGNRSESGWPLKYFNEIQVLLPEDFGQIEIRTSSSSVEAMEEEISGLVVDEDGNPIGGAWVELLNRELVLLPNPIGLGGRISLVITENYHCQTGSDGYFELVELNPGTTDIIIKADNYKTEVLEDISTGTRELKVVLSEPTSYTLSGEVVDGDGNPISDVQITLARDEGQVITSTTQTDTSGGFQFDDILEPTIERNVRLLFARKAGFGTWGKILDTTGGESYVQITLLPEETVSGRVIDDAGNPIAKAEVLFWSSRSRNTDFFFTGSWKDIAPRVKTDTDGRFIFSGIPTESNVNFRVFAEGYSSNGMKNINTGDDGGYAIRQNNGMIMTFGSINETEGEIEFVLQKGTILRGAVHYEGTNQPVQRIKVSTQSTRGGGSSWSEATTDDTGRFELTSVSPNPCNLMVMFEEDPKDSLPEWTAAAIELDDLTPGVVVENLKLVFEKGGIIRGKVTDSVGKPLHGIDIAFYSAARPRSGAACQYTHTAEDGTWAYRFPPGEVYAYIRTDIIGASWSRQNYTMNIEAGQEIENIDFVLNREVAENSPYR